MGHVDVDEALCHSRNTHDEGFAGDVHGECALVGNDDDLMMALEGVVRS